MSTKRLTFPRIVPKSLLPIATDSFGTWTLEQVLPIDQRLEGLDLVLQAYFAAPVGLFGAQASDGLRLVLGY